MPLALAHKYMVIKADTQHKVLKVRFVPQLVPWAFRSRCGYPDDISANLRLDQRRRVRACSGNGLCNQVWYSVIQRSSTTSCLAEIYSP